MGKNFHYIFLLLVFLVFSTTLQAQDLWDDLTQISFAAVRGSLIGTLETIVEPESKREYKIFIDSGITEPVLRLVSLSNSGELIKNDIEIKLYANNEKGLRELQEFNMQKFPNFLPANPIILKNAYQLSLGAEAEVAGRSCQWYWLRPTDKKYYSLAICADKKNYYPLAKYYVDNQTNKNISGIKFTQISFEKPLKKQLEKSKLYKLSTFNNIPLIFSPRIANNVNVNDPLLKKLPPNFYIISERKLPTKDYNYYYVSNGIVYLSLFIKPVIANTNKINDLKPKIKKIHIYGAINQFEYQDNLHDIVIIGNLSLIALQEFIEQLKF